MSVENGIIKAPVGISDVKSVLSTTSNDLGTLCTSNNINRWARYKPISCSLLEFTYWDSDATHYPAIASWGLGEPAYSTNAVTAAKTVYPYTKPSGGQSSPYRLGDFRMYYHNASAPMEDNGTLTFDAYSAAEGVGYKDIVAGIHSAGTTEISFSELVSKSVIPTANYLCLVITDSSDTQLYIVTSEYQVGTTDSSTGKTLWNIIKLYPEYGPWASIQGSKEYRYFFCFSANQILYNGTAPTGNSYIAAPFNDGKYTGTISVVGYLYPLTCKTNYLGQYYDLLNDISEYQGSKSSTTPIYFNVGSTGTICYSTSFSNTGSTSLTIYPYQIQAEGTPSLTSESTGSTGKLNPTSVYNSDSEGSAGTLISSGGSVTISAGSTIYLTFVFENFFRYDSGSQGAISTSAKANTYVTYTYNNRQIDDFSHYVSY